MVVPDVRRDVRHLVVRDRVIAAPEQEPPVLVEVVRLLQLRSPRPPDEPQVHVVEHALERPGVGLRGQHLPHNLVPVVLLNAIALAAPLDDEQLGPIQRLLDGLGGDVRRRLPGLHRPRPLKHPLADQHDDHEQDGEVRPTLCHDFFPPTSPTLAPQRSLPPAARAPASHTARADPPAAARSPLRAPRRR